MTMHSGFGREPGSPERRDADKGWIASHKTAAVKNPTRYNVDNDRAFGIVSPGAEGGWVVKWRGGVRGEDEYATIDALLDDGWTVD